MAAVHANRSPSPIVPSSRPINPSLRNSESNSAVRRSFSAKPSVLTNPRRFDPTTPANSPSDFARRDSVDSYPKEKENCEKDHNIKVPKFQPSAKGSKNFKSPTISAAYKFSPSPKKKVLVERNDPIRTSISLSDGKAMLISTESPNVSVDLESKTDMEFHKGQRIESSLDLNDADLAKNQAVQEAAARVSKPLKTVSFSEVPSDSHTESFSESVISEPDSSKMESSLKYELPCLWDSSSIAPLDADPSLPPYDPKTNYLSPRPQFLHYKPNPRVKILLNMEKGLEVDELKQLEDSLLAEILSESFSDSDGAEDTLSEDPLKEEMGVIVSEDLVVGVEKGIKDSPLASEPFQPIGTALPNAVFVENAVKKNEKKPRLISRLVCFSMFLMLLIACASDFVLHSPAFDDIALTDVSKLHDQSRFVAASAKMDFDQLARHVNQFSVDSVSYISNMVNDIVKGGDIGSLQFTNMSSALQNDGWNQGGFLNKEKMDGIEDLEEDGWNQGGFLNGKVSEELVEVLEEDKEFKDDIDSEEIGVSDYSEEDGELDEVADTEMVISEEEEVYSEVEYSDDILEEEVGTGDNVLEAENVCPDCVNSAELESEDSENIENHSIPDAEIDQLGAISKANDRELLEAAATETAETKFYDGHEIGTLPSSMDEKIPSDSLTEAVQSSLLTELPPAEDKFPIHYVMGLSLIVASLFVAAAAAAYAYHHKRNQRPSNVVVHENQLKRCEQTHHKDDRKLDTQNWQQTESPFSESSGFQKTAASYSMEMREVVGEAQSIVKKTKKYYSRREPPSAVSSTSEYTTGGSPSSYGSFTTFERIPIKNNTNRDEEVITPVRRSGRIRNH